jgi:N-acetylglutamate synthase-like GNAT family acetyltransferase
VTIAIRPATIRDSARVAELNSTLGYPFSAEIMTERLGRVLALEAHVVFVAELEGTVAGWIEGGEQEVLAVGRMGEILGLVVADYARKHGIGRRLVEAVETWARARGFSGLTVRSNVIRPESHAFYERIGFTRFKTQHAYRKVIRDAGSGIRDTR